ncbi:adenosylmethionine decarboxylase [Salmonella enterica]|nr:adenosylmethionine decarboxylase [Salmonella enterica]
MNDHGYHYVWDIVLQEGDVLKNAGFLDDFFRDSLKKSGFNIIGNLVHKFTSEGEGVTGIYLLSESHLSFHTYPESNYISIDVYTCGRTGVEIYQSIESFFSNNEKILMRTLDRGSSVDRLGDAYAFSK